MYLNPQHVGGTSSYIGRASQVNHLVLITLFVSTVLYTSPQGASTLTCLSACSLLLFSSLVLPNLSSFLSQLEAVATWFFAAAITSKCVSRLVYHIEPHVVLGTDVLSSVVLISCRERTARKRIRRAAPAKTIVYGAVVAAAHDTAFAPRPHTFVVVASRDSTFSPQSLGVRLRLCVRYCLAILYAILNEMAIQIHATTI